MSQSTWTRTALRSEIQPYEESVWRVVEAQHVNASMQLVGNPSDQADIEHAIEPTKPGIPKECQHLDFLLFSPFRYEPYPRGSRFRRAGPTTGVWYGAEHIDTVIAEMAFYRILFFYANPDIPFPAKPSEYTVFSASKSSLFSVDLTKGKLSVDKDRWSNLSDYQSCQNFADAARAAGVEIIRYASVRDVNMRANIAVLSCRAFSESKAVNHQTWHVNVGPEGVWAECEHPKRTLEFRCEDFASDPRLRRMDWSRPISGPRLVRS